MLGTKKAKTLAVIIFFIVSMFYTSIILENYWLTSLSAFLVAGLYFQIELARKLAIVSLVIISIVLIFLFYPMNIEYKDSIFWNMNDGRKVLLLSVSELLMICLIYFLKEKFPAKG